ncbi:thioredoxin reductase 1, cytoplasmic-like [Styela clava]
MAPIPDVQERVQKLIKENVVMLFSKSYCPYCKEIKKLFNSLGISFHALELDLEENGEALQMALLELSGQKTVPNTYINGVHLGGADATKSAHSEGRLLSMLSSSSEYDYDLVVIGGGSGGLAAAKEAGRLGKKVALCDFVKPSPLGTAWGLGGTCVNVGCIPKKLMHQTALLGNSLKDAQAFGWNVNAETVQHDWANLVEGVQNYIGSLNWGYRVALREKSVAYLNAYAEFVDQHTIKTKNKRGVEKVITANNVIVAVGERPKYPDLPNAKELCITSDDLFSLQHCPGKTLVIGASYVALECAGFLSGLGLDVTVMVRSIFLRGFDQDMAERAGNYLEKEGIRVWRRFVPTAIEKIEDGAPGKIRVSCKCTDSDDIKTEEFNTVLVAIGRESCTKTIGLDNAGVVSKKNGKIPTNDYDQTNVSHIYSIGDNAEGRPELTPVAIQAGVLLSKRLFAGSKIKCDYDNVPTTVFTPLEYSACGLSEEKAIEKYGEDNIEVYHSDFWPLEWTVAGRGNEDCYAKIITNLQENERVIGMHYMGPNAGEVMQGYAAAMKCGMTKAQLDQTIGIHPTTAETFTTLNITKRSGESIKANGC